MTEPRPLGSRYVLHERLGRGASGEVWRGADRDGHPYAVKVLHEQLTQNRAVVDRFVAERGVLAGIEHPNVVRVVDLVAEGSTLAIVMELVDGPDLRALLRRRGTLPPAAVARVGAQVAAGLRAAHDRGVVHRDVKPENLLVREGPAPEVLVSDFGVARILSDASAGGVLGTPQYFAPETIEGAAPSPASDLYAVGITLYELCCGVTPFGDRRGTEELLAAHVGARPGRPGGVPDDLWRAIELLLSKSPWERPGARSLAEYLEALAPRLEGLPAAPRLDAPPPGAARTDAPTWVASGAGHPAPGPSLPAPPAGAYAAAPPPGGRGTRVLLLVSALVIVASAVLIGWAVTRDRAAPEPAEASRSATPSGASAAGGSAAAPLPRTGRLCTREGMSDFPVVGVSHRGQTSCEFAVTVRDTYVAAGGRGQQLTLPSVRSKASGHSYKVTCTPRGGAVSCDYGDEDLESARVLLYEQEPPAG